MEGRSTKVVVMTISSEYDAFLFDLDGTVWEGGRAIEGAVDSVNALDKSVVYITNNASRHPSVVADMLTQMGIPTKTGQVLTAAQAAVWLASEELKQGDGVYVLGADSFKDLVADAGFTVVDSADANPKAVLHGHNPDTGWAQLSEAALAIHRGARYIASNLDTTLPAERGLMVGNGSMVAAVTSATGVVPVSAGKPEPAMFYQAAQMVGASRPLAVGDRLNTDIAGGVAADMDVFHVLTGVSKHWALVHAIPAERPTFIARNLTDLFQPREQLLPTESGGFVCDLDGADLVLRGGTVDSTSEQALRTVLEKAWAGDTFTGKVHTVGEFADKAVASWL